MISPPFSAFAGCCLPFLRERRQFLVCGIREKLLQKKMFAEKSTPKAFSGMRKEEKLDFMVKDCS